MTILIGNNADGKTVYLYKLARECGSCSTNLPEIFYTPTSLNKVIVDDLAENVLISKIVVNGGNLLILDEAFQYSAAFLEILALLCADEEWIILDEPDVKLENEHEMKMLRNAIARVSLVKEKVVIATHDEILIDGFSEDCFMVSESGISPLTEKIDSNIDTEKLKEVINTDD